MPELRKVGIFQKKTKMAGELIPVRYLPLASNVRFFKNNIKKTYFLKCLLFLIQASDDISAVRKSQMMFLGFTNCKKSLNKMRALRTAQNKDNQPKSKMPTFLNILEWRGSKSPDGL